MNLQQAHRRNFSSIKTTAMKKEIHKSLLSTRSLIALSAAISSVMSHTSVTKADVFGNNGGTQLNLSTNWIDETNGTVSAVPGTSDIARWDSNSAGGTFTLGTATTWGGISIANPTAAVTIGSTAEVTAGYTLTLNGSGVDMTAATQNLTVVDNSILGAAQTWNVSTGRTFNQSGTLTNGGFNLTIAGAGNTTIAGAMNGTGLLTMTGTGTLNLAKASTNTGGVLLLSGNTALSAPAGAGTGTINLSGGTLTVSNAGSTAVSAPIYVNSTSTIAGSGTQEFSSVVTGSGTLNLTFGSGATFDLTSTTGFSNFAGLLEMGSSIGAIRFGGSSSGGSIIKATVDLGTSTGSFNDRLGGTISLGALQGGSGTILTGSTSASDATTYSIGALGLSTVFNGSITNGSFSGSATTALTVVGGQLTLAGSGNTYTAATTISGGTLQIGNGGTTGSIGAAAITNNSVLAFNPGTGGAFTFANAISGSGVVNHVGVGITTLTGNTTYSGGTNINAGTLQADNASSALGTGNVTVNSSGTLGGIGNINAAVTVNSGGFLSPGDVGVNHGNGTGVGTLSVNSLSLTSGAVVNYDIGSLASDMINVTSGNALTLGSDTIDLYQAGTNSGVTLNGTYNLFNVSGGFTGSVSGLTVGNPQPTLSYTFGTSGNFVTLTIGGGASASVWNSNTGGSWATSANWTGGIPNGQFAIASFGTSPGIISPSTITLDGSKTVGTLNFNNSVGNGLVTPTSYTIAQGTGGSLIFDNGTSLATLTDTNGTQLISAPAVLNSSLSIAVVNAPDTITLSGPVSGAGGISTAGAGTVILGGTDSFAGNLSVASGTTILSGSNSAVVGSTTIGTGATLQVGNGAATGSLPSGAVSNAGSLIFNVSTGTTAVSSSITGTGTLTQSGNGTVSLSGTNSYTGTTTINSGTLQLASASALGTGSLVLNAGTLDLNGFNASIGSLTGAGTIDDVAGGGSSSLTLGNGTATTFSGSIKNTTGVVNITKAGTATLTLSGSNSYTGSTTISAGAIKIASGGSLNSTGTIYDNITDGLVLGDGVTVGNPMVLGTGLSTNEFVNVSDANASATLASNVTVSTTADQLRLGITGSNATLTVTGNENSTGTIGILTRGTLIFAGNGTFAVTNSSTGTANALLVARSGNLTITLENNAVVSSQANIDLGQAQTTDGTFVATIQDNALLSAGTDIDLEDLNSVFATSTFNLNGGTISTGSFQKHYNDSSHTATVNLNGGVIAATSSTTAFLPAFVGLTMNVQTGGAIFNDNGNAITVAAPFTSGASPDGGFTKRGIGNLTLAGSNSYNGATNISAGTLTFAAPAALPIYTTLNLAANTTAVAAPFVAGNTKNTLFASNLNLAGTTNAWTSKVDLTNNDLVVQNGNLKTITNQIKQGFGVASAPFQGSGGITSSTAAADSTHLTALGVIQNSSDGTPGGPVLYSSFDGQNSVDTDVLVKYTYFGDADLNGKVDGSDYSRIDSGFTTNATGWFNGDFNYDGVINGSDYTLIDNAFNTQGAQISAELATPTAQLAGGSAVPEPATLGLLALAMGGLLGRRRR